MAVQVNNTDSINEIKTGEVNNFEYRAFENLIFKRERIEADLIDRVFNRGMISRETIVIPLLNGKKTVLFKITGFSTSIRIQSKDIDAENYFNHDMYIKSMIHGVLIAEELQKIFNKRWVNSYREYLIANEKTYNPDTTNEELFQVLLRAS